MKVDPAVGAGGEGDGGGAVVHIGATLQNCMRAYVQTCILLDV